MNALAMRDNVAEKARAVAETLARAEEKAWPMLSAEARDRYMELGWAVASHGSDSILLTSEDALEKARDEGYEEAMDEVRDTTYGNRR